MNVNCHLGALDKASMAVLPMPLSDAALKKALQFLTLRVFPRIREPLQFADLFIRVFVFPLKQQSISADVTTTEIDETLRLNSKTASQRHQTIGLIGPIFKMRH